MKTHHFKLKNGLTVIAKPIQAVPVVSVYLWYQVGSRNEPAGQSGLAHFLEHMLFKGTKQFPKGEIARQVERTGGQQNAFTSYDYTAYFATVPAQYLELVLKIEADRMQQASLNAKEFEQERTVILSELKGNRNHPQVRFQELINAQTWITHPYRRPIIGWQEEVETLTLKQLQDFYAAYYQPDNATLVVAGDFTIPQLRNLLRRYFYKIPGGKKIAAKQLQEELPSGERRVHLKDHGSAAMFQINLPIPAAGDKDHYAITVLNEVLSKGKTARMYQALVDTGLATAVVGSPYEMIDPGVWTLRVHCQRGVQPQQVEKVVLAELEKAKNQLLSEKEFHKAVNQTRAELIYAKDSITDQAMLLGFYQTVAQDWKLPDLYPERVAAVTRPAVQLTAKKYFVRDRMTIGHFIPHTAERFGSEPRLKSDIASLKPIHTPENMPVLPPISQPVRRGASAKPSRRKTAAGRKYVLSNGLTVLVQANPGNPMFVLTGLVRGGIAQEPEDLPGLAAVHAHMLDRGDKKRTARQIAQALEFKGAVLSFAARPEMLNISGEALSEDLDMLLEILAKALCQPVFPKRELEKVRQKTLTACLAAQDNSDLQAWQGFYELAYPAGHPRRRSLITAEAGVKKIQQQDLLKYHQNTIVPSNTILSISGNVMPATVAQLVKKYFGNWQSVGRISPMVPLAAMPRVKKSRQKSLALPGKSESIVVLGHEGIHRKDPEYYQAFVANQILGGAGLSSLLMREVREKAGLTYSIYSHFKLMAGERPWCLVLQANPRQVKKAVRLSLTQIEYLQAGKISPKLLEDNQERLVGGLAMSQENNSGIAYLNREVEYHNLGPDYPAAYARGIREVTFKSMVRAARDWLHPDRVLMSVAEPEK
ncbi:insulinase family protein [bacterium]|nr:insulinase family protein [bacterium]